MPEQRLTRQIVTPVALQSHRVANRLPRGIPHDRQLILTHRPGHDAHRCRRERRQRRHRRRRFAFALQLAKGLVDLLRHAAAIDVPHHDQRHGIRGIPFLIERLQLGNIDRFFQRGAWIMSQHRGTFQAIAPPAIFRVQRPGRQHVISLQGMIHRLWRHDQLSAGIRQPAQRLFQQIVAVIRQAEIKHGVVIRDKRGRHRTIGVNALLP